jgi:hypothetical protein
VNTIFVFYRDCLKSLFAFNLFTERAEEAQ